MTEERRLPIYCTGGCDACRDYARELGVPLIVSALPQPATEPAPCADCGAGAHPETPHYFDQPAAQPLAEVERLRAALLAWLDGAGMAIDEELADAARGWLAGSDRP